LEEKEYRKSSAGVHCFGNNIYIVGGKESSMEQYDVVKNEMKTLASLPYTVSCMATVAYKDNIIILGGQNNNQYSLNDVLMYNTHSLECKRLPSMLEKRSLCAAVILGDVIVVMGGWSKNAEGQTTYLNTVEYYVMGASTWQELPAMNLARCGATACVYVYEQTVNRQN
jgi:N-acetylneuraminic acid mutarotase